MNLMDHLGPFSQLTFFCDYFRDFCGQKEAEVMGQSQCIRGEYERKPLVLENLSKKIRG